MAMTIASAPSEADSSSVAASEGTGMIFSDSPSSQWYEIQRARPGARGGTQSAEVKSLNAKITQNTQLLDLTKEERDLMSRHWTSEALQQFVKEAYDKSQRKPRSKTYEKLRSFLYDFSGVVGQICGIVSAVIPFGSEYTAALAATAVLCKVLSNKADIEAKIVDQIRRLKCILPSVDYFETVTINPQMTEAIQAIRGEIVSYLYEVIAYSKKSRLEHLAGSFITSFENKFGQHVNAIDCHFSTIKNIQSTATLAVSLDTLDKLDKTTQFLLQMFHESRKLMTAMLGKLEDSHALTLGYIESTARLHVSGIHRELLPERYDIQEVTTSIENAEKLLPPQERWQARRIEDDVKRWLAPMKRRPLLWISGQAQKNRISWLSPFSIDLAETLALESDIGLAYVFCDDGRSDYPSPDFVVRCLIGQLLRSHPRVALDFPDDISKDKACSIRTSTKKAKAALEFLYEVLARLRMQSDWPRRGYFLLVDRIDLVRDEKGCDLFNFFIPQLQKLSNSFRDINVVLTSALPADAIEDLDQHEICLTQITSGPPNPVAMRDMER